MLTAEPAADASHCSGPSSCGAAHPVPRSCVVLGAGVIGLTTAILLQRCGWKVAIVAESLPHAYDPEDPTYASPKAGAHWCSYASNDDLRLQGFELETFKILWEMAGMPDSPIMRAPSLCFMGARPANWQDPWYAKHVPDFRYLTEAELPAGQGFGYGYTTVCINVPRYLEALSAEFQQLGGTLVRRRIAHIDEAFGQDTSLVVNCSGLGARTLGGVLDSDVFPIRGQIALIRGQIDHAALTTEHRLQLTDNESSTYVIPRNDGTCVIGGTFIEGDSDMTVRSSTFHAFLGRTAAIHPQIAAWRDHHGVRPGNDDAGVSAHTVGLRPARRGGVRIDAEHKHLGGHHVVIVHHYGHGPYGFQASWGSADAAIQVVERAFAAKAAEPGIST